MADQGAETDLRRQLEQLIEQWRDPDFWKDTGALMDSHDCAKELSAVLRSAGRAALQPPAWRPIETAPQDRRWLLVWCEDVGYSIYRFGPGLIEAEEPQPTHWLPLPDPPAVGGDAPPPPQEQGTFVMDEETNRWNKMALESARNNRER